MACFPEQEHHSKTKKTITIMLIASILILFITGLPTKWARAADVSMEPPITTGSGLIVTLRNNNQDQVREVQICCRYRSKGMAWQEFNIPNQYLELGEQRTIPLGRLQDHECVEVLFRIDEGRWDGYTSNDNCKTWSNIPTPINGSCSAPAGPSTPPTKIKIGAVRSPSGGLEMIGYCAFGPVLNYWVQEVNAAGGINVAGKYLPVEVTIRNDTSQISVMTSLLTTMIESGDYDFVLAPVSTPFLQAAAQICNANEYILMGAEGGCTSIMGNLVNLPYLFGVLNFANHNQMEELFKILRYCQTNEGASDPMKVYIIYIDDLDGDEYTGAFGAEIGKAANSGHFTVVGNVSVPVGTTDVKSHLEMAAGNNTDLFCSFTYPPMTTAVVEQAITNDINFDAMVLGWGANFEYFYDVGTGGFGAATEGIIGLGAWNEDTSPAAAAFAADMIARHGRTYMDWWGQLYYYAGLQCFQQAIERAGTLDQSIIRDILATEHFTTVLGDTWFEDANGNHPIAAGGGLLAVECHPGQIGQWQSGIFEVIDLGPNNTAAGIYPKPNWPAP